MILIDTSVIISFLRGDNNKKVQEFDNLIGLGVPFGITECVYLEVLQGAASEKDYVTLKKYLDTLNCYSLVNAKESFARAARIYFTCKAKGIIIRSSLDCLIALVAIEHGLTLLHNDKDFDRIAMIVPELKCL